MSAPNFSYDRRCVVVPSENLDREDYPEANIAFGNDRSYPSCYLNEYKGDFSTIVIVLTSGYYIDACIDIVDQEDKANELIGYADYYSNHNRQELIDDICYFLGCSPNFANTRLKGCRLGSPTYIDDLKNAFTKIVEDWRDREVKRANKIVDHIKKTYGFTELVCRGIFSNGEAIYEERR